MYLPQHQLDVYLPQLPPLYAINESKFFCIEVNFFLKYASCVGTCTTTISSDTPQLRSRCKEGAKTTCGKTARYWQHPKLVPTRALLTSSQGSELVIPYAKVNGKVQHALQPLSFIRQGCIE